MSYDNRIISSNPYVINTIDTDNRILRRHYNKVPTYTNKKHDSSSNFKETLNSVSSISESNNFEEPTTFNNELDNVSLPEDKSVINKSNFNTKNFSYPDSTKSFGNSELHDKINEAMSIEVDLTDICEKIKRLNSLKKESKY